MQGRLTGVIVGCLLLAVSSRAFPQASPKAPKISDDVVKIGVLTDMSGLYSDGGGPGSVAAAQLAIDDFGGKVLGKPIVLVYADHQNKADVGASKAREWFDTQQVDLIVDVPNSGVALAVSKVANEKRRLFMVAGGGSTRLTNEDCNPYTIHYVYDTYATGGVTGRAVVQQGGNSWFFITADYAFGHSLQDDTSREIKAVGGQVLGSVLHPLSAPDFSSYLLQAQSSGAKVIGLADAGGDTINAIKTATEFGITKKQTLAGLLFVITDVNSLTLKVAQGMYLSEGYYWDLNDDTRRLGKRFFDKIHRMPTMYQAGVYSAVLQYLKAIQATGTDDTDTVIKKLKETTLNDDFVKGGKVRADGRMVHDFYLFQVKAPSESKYPWDYYKLITKVPGDQAFQPLSESRCPLIKK